MSKFKTGDKVVVVPNGEGFIHKNCGEEFIYMADFSINQSFGHIENTHESTTAPWSSLMLKSEYDMQQNQNKTETKRIPFDLERARKGDKMITGAGRPFRIICFDFSGPRGSNYPNIVGLKTVEGVDVFVYVNEYGKDVFSDHEDCNIFMAPVEKTGWIVLIKNRNDGTVTAINTVFYDEGRAHKYYIEAWASSHDLVVIKQITWME